MMLSIPLQEIARTLGQTSQEVAGEVTGICIDSRRVAPGDLFVALPGQRTSGERFIGEALARGASAVVASRSADAIESVFRVEDPLSALGRVASLLRGRFEGPVVGITGTAGKTTVKENLLALVPDRLNGVFPSGSFNNAIGVPLTLSHLEKTTGLLVVELGTNAPGEIAALCAIARPNVGVMTAIGPGHLEGLGSVEQVLEEKLSLARALPPGATLIANGEDEYLRGAQWPAGLNVVPVAPPPETSPGKLSLAEGGPEISVPVRGHVGRLNLWLAVCVARHLGCTDEEIAEGARSLRAPRLRGEEIRRGDCLLVLDCYNANPLSMNAALDDLASRGGFRSAVLGDMLELGPESAALHARIGEKLARLELDRVLFIGESGAAVLEGFERAGGSAAGLDLVSDVKAARAAFAELVSLGGVMLVKASRDLALERLLEGDDE
jgi:UDP-N-acetylmuramoyl-tripeptide--D-alanyl-D-alanine ligase